MVIPGVSPVSAGRRHVVMKISPDLGKEVRLEAAVELIELVHRLCWREH